MTQVNDAIVEALAGMNTKTTEVPYHFKSYDADSEGFKRLNALLESGKLTADDIEVIKEEGKADKYKRKSTKLSFEVPVIEIAGATKEVNDHVQCLVNKAIEAAQKPAVDAADLSAMKDWRTVLSTPFAQRTASIKVTTELVNKVVELMKEGLLAQGVKEKGVELACALGTKKFTVAACQPIPNEVVEKVQGLVVGWYSELDADTAGAVEPVMNLWAANIEKVLQPAEEYNVEDMF